jgi:hypothetical protein
MRLVSIRPSSPGVIRLTLDAGDDRFFVWIFPRTDVTPVIDLFDGSRFELPTAERAAVLRAQRRARQAAGIASPCRRRNPSSAPLTATLGAIAGASP